MATGTSALWGCTAIPEPSPTLLDPATLGSFADDTTIQEIGGAYLDGTPPEARQDRLVRALLEDERGDLVSQDDPEALKGFLADRIRRDFEADRTVIVEGWVLAVTEARQAALFSLTP